MDENKTYFDVNVLVEVVEQRAKAKPAKNALMGCTDRYISSLTVHIFMYFELKIFSGVHLEKFLYDFTIFDFTASDVNWAFKNCRSDDFEDALQIAVAIRNGCSTFVTLDRQLAKSYGNLPTLKIKLL